MLVILRVRHINTREFAVYQFICSTGVFIALGCSGIVPMIHIIYINGLEVGSEQSSLGWLILMGVCYIVGALLYALRIPERFFPGKCNLIVSCYDILLHSVS